jgi:hypothetical protein
MNRKIIESLLENVSEKVNREGLFSSHVEKKIEDDVGVALIKLFVFYLFFIQFYQ